MLIDLHNHTYLCNHAGAMPLDYARKAFKLGCKFYGFSDHAPMNFDEKYRMSFAQIQTYEQLIGEVRDEFFGKMEVLLGYEVDFMSDSALMDERILGAKCDYLIGSVHFLNSWGFDNPEFISEYKGRDVDLLYEEYFAAIESMAKSGKFDIIGHIDLIKVFGFLPKKDVRIHAKNALMAIKKADLVVELNSAGYRKPIGELYPSDKILGELANLDVKITFSSDAHEIDQVGLNMNKTMQKAREFGYSEAIIFKKKDKIPVKF